MQQFLNLLGYACFRICEYTDPYSVVMLNFGPVGVTKSHDFA